MSTIFLECQFFRDYLMGLSASDARPIGEKFGVDFECCFHCHSFPQRAGLIYIKPFKVEYPGDTNPDWSLPIEAIVCCNLHDFVRALPRSFWTDEMKRRGLSIKPGYNYSHSTEDDTEQPRGRVKGRVTKKKDEEEPSFDDFLNR